AAQRSPLSRRGRRVVERPAAGDHRGVHPAGRDRGRPVPHLVRLRQLPARLLELPHAVDDADRLALCRHPAARGADRPVRLRAAGERPAQRLRERDGGDGRRVEAAAMSAPMVLLIMTFLFLFFGYMGVPVAFSLIAGVVIGSAFTDVTYAAIVQKMFDGVDAEALLAIPFFLLVGELMSSANV